MPQKSHKCLKFFPNGAPNGSVFWLQGHKSQVNAFDPIDKIGICFIASRYERCSGQVKQEKGTKTKSGTRDVLLLPPALEALKNQKAFTYLEDKRVFYNSRINTLGN